MPYHCEALTAHPGEGEGPLGQPTLSVFLPEDLLHIPMDGDGVEEAQQPALSRSVDTSTSPAD